MALPRVGLNIKSPFWNFSGFQNLSFEPGSQPWIYTKVLGRTLSPFWDSFVIIWIHWKIFNYIFKIFFISNVTFPSLGKSKVILKKSCTFLLVPFNLVHYSSSYLCFNYSKICNFLMIMIRFFMLSTWNNVVIYFPLTIFFTQILYGFISNKNFNKHFFIFL